MYIQSSNDIMLRQFVVAAVLIIMVSHFSGALHQQRAAHLVVISHGLMGNERELSYLEKKLLDRGVLVLSAKSNRYHRTLDGIEIGGNRLAEEVESYVAKSIESIESISFVGNSLGGLYARYAASKLYDENKQLIAGLRPHHFLTIATPHLGVMNSTYLDDHQIIARYDFHKVKAWIGRLLMRSGRELFMLDHPQMEKTLLFKMATDNKFLNPLKAFRKLRAYANLRQDFMVPLGTAAFLAPQQVDYYRSKFNNQGGIVGVIQSEEVSDLQMTLGYHTMIGYLDSCGWEKVLVHFNDVLPLAHNKICALSKYGSLLDHWLGFSEGQFVMDDAAEWLASQ